MAIEHKRWISLEEYHEMERTSEFKLEYANGRVYAMSGGTFNHSQIALNLTAILTPHLRGKVCRVANADMKVLPLGDENPSYFPDVTVTCTSDDYKGSSTAIRSPRLIIEVLSPGTASKDRGEKLLIYQSCPTVEEYMLVSTQRQQVEVYHREGAHKWTLIRYTHEHTVLLASVELTLPVKEIYADTDVPALASVFFTD